MVPLDLWTMVEQLLSLAMRLAEASASAFVRNTPVDASRLVDELPLGWEVTLLVFLLTYLVRDV